MYNYNVTRPPKNKVDQNYHLKKHENWNKYKNYNWN